MLERIKIIYFNWHFDSLKEKSYLKLSTQEIFVIDSQYYLSYDISFINCKSFYEFYDKLNDTYCIIKFHFKTYFKVKLF